MTDRCPTCVRSGPGACLRTYRDVVVAELQKNGVVADVRKLSVGDFLWVARPRSGRQVRRQGHLSGCWGGHVDEGLELDVALDLC